MKTLSVKLRLISDDEAEDVACKQKSVRRPIVNVNDDEVLAIKAVDEKQAPNGRGGTSDEH